MKTILLALLLSFSFIVSSYADSDNCIAAYENKDYQTAAIECINPANLGEIYPQNILGWLYLYGPEDIKDYSKALTWLSKSSDQGVVWAKGQLGLMYQNGYGVSKDYNKAFTFLTDAGEEWEESLEELKLLIQEESDNNEIFQAIDKIKNTKTIPANRIGKWYASDSELESITCNGNDTSELIVLHDQILIRSYSDDYSLIDSNSESTYYNFIDNNPLFFPENIIYFSDTSPEIKDFYFEKAMFPELDSNLNYSQAKLYKCLNLNEQLDYILLESDAIEFDKLVFSAKKECQNKKPIDCLRKFINFADVSKNNELSRAELTRFSKFLVKWLTLKNELNLTERMGSSAATMVIAPALAEFILLNYDYDNDEHIDIKEMTFDLVNISGSSELNNKIIRKYIEALDLASESKINASRMLDDLF